MGLCCFVFLDASLSQVSLNFFRFLYICPDHILNAACRAPQAPLVRSSVLIAASECMPRTIVPSSKDLCVLEFLGAWGRHPRVRAFRLFSDAYCSHGDVGHGLLKPPLILPSVLGLTGKDIHLVFECSGRKCTSRSLSCTS